jgi:hypothetical protein
MLPKSGFICFEVFQKTTLLNWFQQEVTNLPKQERVKKKAKDQDDTYRFKPAPT